MIYLIWIVGIVIFVFILLWLNALRGTGSVLRKLDEKIGPAIEAIQSNSEYVTQIINDIANIPEARNHLYNWLKEKNKESLFPDEFRKLEKIAESDLAQWLMHPNELKEPPYKIEFVKKIDVQKENKRGKYFLFKFCVKDDHWASKNGWMAGAAGPFWDDEEMPSKALGTFSELISFEKLSEEEHIEFLKNKAKAWGVVVPT
jgi:hypothetical protein